MIKLTRLNGQPMVLNADLIETVEATPDTVITLTTEKKLVVQEDVDTVIDRVVGFHQRTHIGLKLLDSNIEE
jgi:flagellar protein FlbD